MNKLLVTGATGFIGRALLQKLLADGKYQPRAAIRRLEDDTGLEIDHVAVGDISSSSDWTGALSGIDSIVHTAARAHKPKETAASALVLFREINTEACLNLARQAAAAGVKRFVFISSIGVVGNQSIHPFSELDPTHPAMPYAISTLEAEQGLRRLADASAMEVVIIRPPLVYGPQAPGNFGRLVGLVKTGLPLPLAAVDNRRSFVSIDNLLDLIVTCLRHPAAANQTFHVSDGMDVSTPELLRLTSAAIGRPCRLVYLPLWLLRLLAKLTGRTAIYQSLCASLQVDISAAQKLLGWQPKQPLEQGIRRAARAIDTQAGK